MTAENQSRARLSRERGTIVKDWGGKIPIALVFPNTYHLGMSSLGFQTIYSILNSYDNIVCERFFSDGDGKSVESDRPLDDFAILAFSISNELDYFNTVEMLSLSNTPLQSSRRSDSDPLVIAGGPCIIANPEPLAPFFDAFAIGEGEAILPALIDAIAAGIEGDRDKSLEAISHVPGMYVPRLHDGKSINRQWAHDIDGFATTSVILTPHTEFSDMYLVEIERGCKWGCRFCLAGYAFRPFRYRSEANLIQQCEKALTLTNKIGLLGACVSDHPQIEGLTRQLRGMGAQISVSSLRVRPVSSVVLQALKDSGAETLTFAPEAGSERLRRIINKGASKEDIVSAITKASEVGIRQLKLYFMIGLPTETDDDIEEIIALALEVRAIMERKRAGCHLTLTFEPFVPKAGTPFQWLPMTSATIINKRHSYLKRQLNRQGIEARTESVSWSMVQGLLSRGDNKLAPAIAKVAGNRSLSTWRQALDECSIDADTYIGREIPTSEKLPWSFIDSGVKPDYLESELDKARGGKTTPPCPIADVVAKEAQDTNDIPVGAIHESPVHDCTKNDIARTVSIECHRCGVC